MKSDYSIDIPAGVGISLNHLRQLNLLSEHGLSHIVAVINSEKFLLSLEPVRFASQALSKIASHNIRIFFVTGRFPCNYSVTQQWLAKNNIPYHKLFHFDKHNTFPSSFYSSANCIGVKALRSFCFQFWIEDSPVMIDIIRRLSNTNIIVFSRRWNRAIRPRKDLIYANNWEEIEDILTNRNQPEQIAP